jgi:hypothetical protein
MEAMGLSTLCISNVPALMGAVGVPRMVALEHPFGRTLGQPGDAEGQRAVLRATLQAGEGMASPGSVAHLPFRWPEPRGKAQTHPPEPPPIATYLMRHPWHLPKFMAREIPD